MKIKLKELSKMKRIILSTMVAAIVAVVAVSQFTNATSTVNSCPEGQVPTSQGCENKTGEVTIPSGGDRVESEPQPVVEPSESELVPSQPSSPSCTE